jgi:hypothetical protein
MGQEVSPAALIEIQRIQKALLGSLSNLTAVKVNALGLGSPLQALQLALIAAPLVCDTLAALKATNWNNHVACLFNLEELVVVNFRRAAASRGPEAHFPHRVHKHPRITQWPTRK